VRSPWLAALPLVAAVTFAGMGSSPAGATGTLLASTGPRLTVVPSTGLAPNQRVVATISGEPPEAMVLVLECVAAAVSIGEDGCENRQNEVVFADDAGTATATIAVLSSITTALGTENCVPSSCFVAAARLSAGNSVSIVGAVSIGFTSARSAGPTGGGPPAPPAWLSPSVAGHPTLVHLGDPAELTLVAGRAGNLSASGAITGPSVTLPAGRAPRPAVSGVALLQLVLAAPGTSWSNKKHAAVVVDVSVAKAPTQQIVCFAGSRAFTYAAVFGTLTTGPHRVRIAIDSHLSTAGAGPRIKVVAARLTVVPAGNPSYLAMRYAPVVFGRPDTASSDTPLLTYAEVTGVPGAPVGTKHIAYTTIWSKEDAGTSFVPFLEWGEWGRMADITQTVALDVTPAGKVLDATYNSCGCQAPFPDNRTSPLEQTMPFEGTAEGTHLMVLNASGNDYQSDTGTSAFRMEQAPVPGPAPGAARETVMDANPWTYRITAEELSRWYSDGSTVPSSPEIGDSRQYAIVDVASTTAGVSAVAVAIRLAGSDVWYSNDLGSGYPLYTGGHGRTAVKLPLGWESRRISGLRLVAYPTTAPGAWSVRDVHVSVIGLTSDFSIERPVLPRLVVTASMP
jgi:hypothetical protein